MGRVGDSYGYQSFLNPQAGSLVPDSFVLDGVTYTVGHIETAADYLTAFGVDRELPVGFTLELDGARFESSDASLTSTTYSHLYTWLGRGSDLKVGEEVTALVVASPTFVVLADPDLAPGNLQARGSDEKVTLTWTAPAEDAASVTGYEVLRAQGKAELTTLAADTGSTDTTYTDGTATESGETYAYQVKALRGEEKSQGSNRAEAFIPATTLVEPEPPVAALQSGMTEVPFNWSLKPSGLDVGDKFRLLFVSSTTRNAESTDIAAYNTWIQNRAAAGHTDIQSYSSTFTAVGSTAAVDARDNTHTTFTSSDKGVAIYWLNGNKVADQYEDFYDESWDDEANRKTEAGTASSDTTIWTGSSHNGTEKFSGSSSRALGQSLVTVGSPDSSAAGDGPLSSGTQFNKSSTFPFYGLSGVFQVATPPPTEVPANWSLIPSGLGVGDEFRLLFMSSTTRNASPTSISTYNTWIQNRAAEGHTDIQDYSDTFRAVGSTEDVDARDNTYTTYTSSDKGVPIYWLNGNKVADEYEDFYDGDWDEEANRKDEDGNASSLIQVWTGSDDDGTEAFSGTTSFALGQEFVALGTLNHASLGPVGNSAANGGKNGSRPVYGLSAVFRVVPVEVPADWSLIPSGLGAGDKFRLLFLSSTKRSIRSTNISDYNTFVQNRAAAGHTDIHDHSDTFRVLGSTGAVAARDNTGTTYTSSDKGIAIYWLNGDKAADQYEDFYDGSWDQQADAWNESGDEYDLTARRLVATGSSKDGTTDPDNPLGASSGEVQMGCLYETSQTNGPVSCNFVTEDIPGDDNQQLYGLSGVFQVDPNNPATGKPVITGTPAVNQTLTADISGIMDADGLPAADQFSYQWVRNDGTDDSDITGAKNATYKLKAADLGKTIKVRVTFTDGLDNEEGPLTSDATRPVTEVGDATGAPAITGTAQVGELLTAGTSNIADPDGIANATFSYQWIAYDGSTDSDIDGATGETYRPLLAHLGQTVKVRVTFTDDDDNAESLTSAATATVTASTYGQVIWAATLTVEEAAGGAFGFSIDGRGSLEPDTFTHDEESFRVLLLLYLEGSALTVRFDNALGTEDFSLYLDDAPFLIESPGAKSSFTFSDHGLTWTDRQEVEVRLTVNNPATGAPVITGTPEVNQTLTADTSGIMDADGLPAADQFSYQWIRSDGTDDSDISGATDSTYRLENADLGNTIKVRVTFTDEAGYEETLTSDTSTVTPMKVPATWSLAPSGLNPGDKFRLLFVSSTTRNAESTDIDTYNTWIQNLAAAGHTDIQSYSPTFTAVGSTADVDARDNTHTTGTGVPIYWLNGNKAADQYEDFYDESWDDEANRKTETGTASSDTQIWTGSDHDGTERELNNTSRALGESFVTIGLPDSSAERSGPLSSGTNLGKSSTYPLYGLSGVFEVLHAEVPTTWSLIPSGLGSGDEFRLLFLSSTKRNAVPTSIDTYNTWIQDLAAAGHTDIQDYSDTFRAVGCTAAVDARDNTNTTYTSTDKGVIIYWLKGARVANQYEDFYDGSWDQEASVRNESGTAFNAPLSVWTGCKHDGTEAFDATDSASSALGSEDTTYGAPDSVTSGSGPLSNNSATATFPSSFDDEFYGLSGVFRVAANTPATGKPVITGTPEVNQTLTADVSGIMDADGLPAADQFSYRWVRNDGATDSDISGATDSTYTLVQADLGQTIKVKVTFTDEGGTEETLTSDATIAVAADATGPILTEARVETSGDQVDLTLDEVLDDTNKPAVGDFEVTADGAPVAIGRVVVSNLLVGASSVLLTSLSPVIYQGQTVIVAYTDPTSGDDTNAIQDAAGNDAASFTTGADGVPAVTNDSTVALPVTGVLVSNIGQTAYSLAAEVKTNQSQGQGFTTGANSGGYTLDSVELDVSSFSGTASHITVSIYSESSDDPGTLVHTLTTPASISQEVTTFTAPSGATLAASTTYYVVIATTDSQIDLSRTDSAAEAAWGASGWSIADNRRFNQGGWFTATRPILMRINGPAAATSTDATLSGLVLNDGTSDLTLTPAFATGTTSYAASVGNTVSQITVTPEKNDSNASVEYLDGNDAAITDADGTATGQQVALAVGANTIKVKVTAEDDATTETYTVVVTREAAVQTGTLVSNLGQTNDTSGDLAAFDQAQAFTTGANSLGYTLESVEIHLGKLTGIPFVSHNVSIWTDSSGSPGASLSRLTKPSIKDGVNTYTTTGISLAADTTYFIVVDSTPGASDRGNIRNTNSDSEDAGAAAGWSIGDSSLHRDHGSTSSWTTFAASKRVRINGQVIVPTEVPTDWSLLPSGLQGGDQFRLLFISSTARDASPSNIATYNTWIQERAAAGHTDIQDYSSDFRAVGSTEDMDARDNTGTTYTSSDKGVAIYWLNGNKVADDYEDFYDESWDEEASMKNELGTAESGVTAWTGSDHDGTESFNNNDGTSRALGNSGNQWVRFGKTDSADHGPLSGATANRTGNKRIYGLSGVFQVAGAAVNHPATGVPTITGTAQVGEKLTADISAIMDQDGLPATDQFAYQWVSNDGADDSDIDGATDSTFTPGASEEGDTIKVRVSFTDNANFPETLTSAATATVAAPAGPTVTAVTTEDLAKTSAKVVVTIVNPQTTNQTVSMRHKKTADTNWNATRQLDTSGTEVKFPLTGLTGRTEYEAQASLDSNFMTGVVSYTFTTLDVPGKPTGVMVDKGNAKLTVTWTAPTDTGGTELTEYKVQWKSGTQSFNSSRQGTAGAMDTSDDITGLNNGTEYTVRVLAVNSVGDGAWSDEAKGTPSTAPGKPSVEVTGTNMQLQVRWTVVDGGAALTGYTLQQKESSVSGWSGAGVTVVNPAKEATTYKIENLTNGTAYTVRLQATNANGDGAWSDEEQGTPTAKPPPSVTITTEEGEPIQRPFTFTVTFSEEVEGFECPGRQCEIGASYVGGAFVAVKDFQEVEVNSGGEHIFTARVEDILTGTLVIAVLEGKAQAKAGGLGNAFGAMQVEVERPALPDIPGVHVWSSEMTPADIGGYLGYGSVGDLMGGSLADDNFNWQGQTYTVKALLYNPAQVQLDLDQALPNRGERMILAVDGRWVTGSNPRQFGVIQGGEALLSYHWHPADPGFEAGRSVVVRLSRQAPNVLVTRDYAALSWSDPQDDSITGYRIERRDRDQDQDGEFTTLVSDTGSADTGYTDRSVEPGGRYAYRVTAMNDYGESEPSGPVEVDIPGNPPDQPTGLGATAASEAVTLSWDDPQDDSITGYKVQWKSGSEDYDGSGGSARQAEIDDPAGRTHTVTGLSNGVEYRFRVIAVNDDGDGAPSAETTGTPGETTRPELSTVTVDDATLTLTYDETLDQASQPATDAFSVAVGGSDRTVDGVSVAGRAVTLTLASEVAAEDTVTVSYTVPADAAAARIRDEAGNGAASFSNRAVVNNTAAPANSPATGAPAISGTAQVDETLTVDTSSIEDADGLDNAGFVYQWLADDADIAGATSDSYTLVEADEGKTIKVQVTFTDDANNDETLTSAATGPVAAAPGGAGNDAIWTSTLTVQRWGNSSNRLFGFDGPLGKGKLEPERFSHDGVEHRVEMLFLQKQTKQLHFVTYPNLAAGSYLLNLDGTPFQFEASGTERRFSFSKSGLKWQKGDVVEVSLFSSDEDFE